MTALSEARAELHKLEATRANLAADAAALKADRAPAEARATANNKRRAKQPIVVLAANSWSRATMAVLRVESYGTATALIGKKPKEIAEAIAGGGVKISYGGGYGASYTARGLSTRVRVPHREDIKAWDRAIAARRRAEDRLQAAKNAEVAAAKMTFENGTKVTFDELVADIAKAAVLTVATEVWRHDPRSNAEHALNGMIDGQYGALTIAKRHVDHLSGKVPLPEGQTCSTCQRQAQESAARNERVARIKALPRRKFTCPDHGKVIGYFERSERGEWVTDTNAETGLKSQRQIPNAPLLYCPRDWHRFLDARTIAADEAKAAKPKRAAKVREITFLCPNPDCGETSTSEIEADQSVTCETCEVNYPVDRVVRVKAAA